MIGVIGAVVSYYVRGASRRTGLLALGASASRPDERSPIEKAFDDLPDGAWAAYNCGLHPALQRKVAKRPSKTEAHFGEEWQKENDDYYVIRLKPRIPDWVTVTYRDVHVAGITVPKYQKDATAFTLGSDRQLSLEREPDNEVDQNAIRVIGVWFDKNGQEHRGRLGYVPRDIAGWVAEALEPEVPVFGFIQTVTLPFKGKQPRVTLDLAYPKVGFRGRKRKGAKE